MAAPSWTRTYRTPLALTAVFVALLAVFAVTPDPSIGDTAAEPTSEPTPGPRECVVCPIDQRCNPGTGRCELVEHTPAPCVESAKFDERAGFCLPEGAPPPPPAAAVSEPTDDARRPRVNRFPPGIRDPDRGRERRGQDLPAIGD